MGHGIVVFCFCFFGMFVFFTDSPVSIEKLYKSMGSIELETQFLMLLHITL